MSCLKSLNSELEAQKVIQKPHKVIKLAVWQFPGRQNKLSDDSEFHILPEVIHLVNFWAEFHHLLSVTRVLGDGIQLEIDHIQLRDIFDLVEVCVVVQFV